MRKGPEKEEEDAEGPAKSSGFLLQLMVTSHPAAIEPAKSEAERTLQRLVPKGMASFLGGSNESCKRQAIWT